jgi:type II secretory pathway pseudopilin PulG
MRDRATSRPSLRRQRGMTLLRLMLLLGVLGVVLALAAHFWLKA